VSALSEERVGGRQRAGTQPQHGETLLGLAGIDAEVGPLLRVRLDDDLEASARRSNRLVRTLQHFEFQSLHVHPNPIRSPSELMAHRIDGEHVDVHLSRCR